MKLKVTLCWVCHIKSYVEMRYRSQQADTKIMRNYCELISSRKLLPVLCVMPRWCGSNRNDLNDHRVRGGNWSDSDKVIKESYFHAARTARMKHKLNTAMKKKKTQWNIAFTESCKLLYSTSSVAYKQIMSGHMLRRNYILYSHKILFSKS